MFRKITINDEKYFREFNMFDKEDYWGSELNFANIYCWKDFDNLKIYVDDKMLIIKGRDFFFPPLVKEYQHYNDALNRIFKYCRKQNMICNIVGITNDFLPFFANYKDKLIYHRELAEYLYNPTDLINFSGKKYHAKRNLIHQFTNLYNYEFVEYKKKYYQEIMDLTSNWIEKKQVDDERLPISRILKNLEITQCFCDLILIDKKIAGFAIGTIYNNIGTVLFEKADIDYIGIYPTLVNLFAKKHFTNVKYINRQEDMGLTSLRQSKESYMPCGFVDKYQLSINLAKN